MRASGGCRACGSGCEVAEVAGIVRAQAALDLSGCEDRALGRHRELARHGLRLGQRHPGAAGRPAKSLAGGILLKGDVRPAAEGAKGKSDLTPLDQSVGAV